jgi:hypothetical protein
VLALPSCVAKLRDGTGGIAQQPVAIAPVHPRARDDTSAIAGADFRLVGVDQHVERRRIDIALLGQHSLERPNAPLDLAQFAVIGMVMIVFHAPIVALGRVQCYLRRR